jgi:hypothetical protein
MSIVEPRNYPVLAGHVVPFDLAVTHDRTERAKNRAQLLRILRGGGIVAPMFGAAVDPDSKHLACFTGGAWLECGRSRQWTSDLPRDRRSLARRTSSGSVCCSRFHR